MKDAIGAPVPRKEDLRLITGRGTTGSLLDYLMPTSAEIPELVIGHAANPAANALGVAVDRLPITPSSLWELIQRELMTP